MPTPKIDPLEALILKAIRVSTPHDGEETPVPEPELNLLSPTLERSEPKPILAIFIYADDTTITIPFPRRPIGLTKITDGKFERPVRVRFRNVDPSFKPKNAANLAAWKTACQAAVKPSNSSSIDLES